TQPYYPREGDLVIFTYRNPLWRICYALAGTGPPYHTGIVVRIPTGELATLEAAPNTSYTVYVLPLPDRFPAYKGSIWVRRLKKPLTPTETEQLNIFAAEQTGKGFAFGRLLVNLGPFRPRGELRSQWFGKTTLDRDRWFCSELVVAAAVAASRMDPHTVPANGIYPRDLLLDETVDFSGTWDKPLLWTNEAGTHSGEPYPEYESLQ
ncbi:MAG: hypothetical protein JNM56_16675, partial [Planctomycetia bacterium]|nr:hypothetical protein [Planctomycetia bacterium]